MVKKNILFIALNALAITMLSSISVLAETGSFTMTRRMVYGYKHHTYKYEKSVNRNILGKAEYNFIKNKAWRNVNGNLGTTLHKKGETLTGSTKWTEIDSYHFNYYADSYSFQLAKGVSLKKGTYGFTVWRPVDETYVKQKNEAVSYIKIDGYVKLY